MTETRATNPTSATAHDLALVLRPERYAVVRRDPAAGPPAWVDWSDPFVSVTRTADELSLLLPESRVPAGEVAARGLRLFAVAGPLSFEASGILHALTEPLAAAGIWLLAISTYDTDYLLVKDADLETARRDLEFRFTVSDGAPGG